MRLMGAPLRDVCDQASATSRRRSTEHSRFADTIGRKPIILIGIGMNGFARSAGSAVGVAVLGAISNSLLDAGGGAGDPATVVWASTWVFVGAAAFAALTLLTAVLMPRDGAADTDAA